MREWQTTLAQLVHYPDFHGRFLNTLSLLEYIGARKIVKSQDETRMTPTVLAHVVEELRHAQMLKKMAMRVGGPSLRSYADDTLVCGREGRAYMQAIDHTAQALLGAPAPWANYLLTTLIVEERAQVLYPVYDALLMPLDLGGPLAAIVREEEGHLSQVSELLISEPQCTAAIIAGVRLEEQRHFAVFFEAVAQALAQRAC